MIIQYENDWFPSDATSVDEARFSFCVQKLGISEEFLEKIMMQPEYLARGSFPDKFAGYGAEAAIHHRVLQGTEGRASVPRARRQQRKGGSSPSLTLPWGRHRGPGGEQGQGGNMIRKLPSGKYRLYSRKKNPKTGRRRNLGTFNTRKAAQAHESAVQYFKRH